VQADLENKLRNEIAVLEKKLVREKTARTSAERLLESKSIELYEALQGQKEMSSQLASTKSELEVALANSQNELNHLLQNLVDIVYEVNNQGLITWLSGGFKNVLGYDKDELLNQPFYSFLPKGYEETVFNFYVDAIEKNQTVTEREVPLMAKNGKVVWLNQSVKLIYNGNEFVKAAVVARDITERKAIESQKEEERLRLKELIRNMPLAILIEDETRHIVQTNQMFCDLFKIPVEPDILVGTDCSGAAEQSKHMFQKSEKFIRDIEVLLEEKKPVFQEQLRMTDGKSLLRDYVPLIKNNEYKGHMWVYADITELEQKEFLLAQNELKYTQVLENLELGILEVDKQGVITKAFPSLTRLLGYTENELLGKNAAKFLLDPDQVKNMDEVNDLRVKGKSSAYEAEVKTKNGGKRNVLISGAPIYSSEGEVEGSIGIHFDITKIKELENYLRKAKQEAELAKKAEESFTARMSHEVRTPLTALQGTLELMSQISDDNQRNQYLQSARTAAKHLRSLVDDVLEFSKIKAGKRKVTKSRFFINAFINDLAQNFKSVADEKGLSFITLYDTSDDYEVQTDAKMLYQILSNLLSNAIKFTAEGYILINVKKRKNDFLEIDVFDTGIGIKPEDQKNIFGDYVRTEDVESNFDGAGLGLGIVKGLLSKLNANITLQSEYGKGSCFTLRMPQKVGAWIENNVPLDSAGAVEKPLLKSTLVIDDSSQIRHYCKSVLSSFDVHFESAINGLDGVSSALERSFDAIIVDYRMPDINGLEAAKRIRENGFEGVVIMATATPVEDLIVEKDFKNIDSVLSKPFLPADMIKSLNKYFELREKTGPATENNLQLLPELDNDSIRSIYGNNAAYMRESFKLFIDGNQENMTGIFEAIDKKDIDKASMLIHKLKPSLMMIGLEKEREKIKNLDKEITQGYDLSKVKRIIEDLQQIIDKQIPILKQQIAKL
jgi:PAS domain S-box-containing protein